jgi:hypothetical protein
MVRERAVDEVELAAERARKAAHVGLKEGAVHQPARNRRCVRGVDHAGGQVDPDRLALRNERGHSPKLPARPAPRVEDARVRCQVPADDPERLIEDRCRERPDEDLVEVGQLVELLDQVAVHARLLEQDGIGVAVREVAAQSRARQARRLVSHRRPDDPDAASPQGLRGVEHARGVPPERADQVGLGTLLRAQLPE